MTSSFSPLPICSKADNVARTPRKPRGRGPARYVLEVVHVFQSRLVHSFMKPIRQRLCYIHGGENQSTQLERSEWSSTWCIDIRPQYRGRWRLGCVI